MIRFLLILLPACLFAQAPTVSPVGKEISKALLGLWAGTLEYRDYSEPPTSDKRVKLPTWLKVSEAGDDIRLDYVYDDGPSKTVTESSLVHIDTASAAYTDTSVEGKVQSVYKIAGLDRLNKGRGVLTLTGPGLENRKPVQVRTTLRIGRNIVEILRETSLPDQPFTFRHSYTMVRAASPELKAQPSQ